MELIQFLTATFEFKSHKVVFYSPTKKPISYSVEITQTSAAGSKVYFYKDILNEPSLKTAELLIRKYFSGEK